MPIRARLVLPLALIGITGALGCATVNYAVQEQLGIHKRDILRSRVESGRKEQQAAQEQFKTTYERFKEVSGFSGGDLEPVYNRLNAEYERSEARANAVRSRITSIEEVAADLFSEWKTEINLISSPQLRQNSQRNLRDTQARYGTLISAMKKAEAKMDPVLIAFRDQVLYLKHNLNARAIASLDQTLASIENDVADLIGEIQASVDEAERFVAGLEAQG